MNKTALMVCVTVIIVLIGVMVMFYSYMEQRRVENRYVIYPLSRIPAAYAYRLDRKTGEVLYLIRGEKSHPVEGTVLYVPESLLRRSRNVIP